MPSFPNLICLVAGTLFILALHFPTSHGRCSAQISIAFPERNFSRDGSDMGHMGQVIEYKISSSPWKDPPFLSSVNHLFNYGPWLNHGELLVITRPGITTFMIYFDVTNKNWHSITKTRQTSERNGLV